MEKKCSQYEALFTFTDTETLNKHLETCKDCQDEHKKMERVSELINEVKPHYINRHKTSTRLKAVCAICAMFLSATTLGVLNINTDISDTIRYGKTLTADDLGLPVDSYGFLVVE